MENENHSYKESQSDDVETVTQTSKYPKWLRSIEITVEPVLLLICFSSSFTDSFITNLIESRICAVELNYSLEICTSTLSDDLEEKVQPFTAQIIMAKTFIEACLPAVLSFFIGPWSDSNGRKPFLLSSVSGYVISYTIWGILAQFDTIPAIYFLLVTIPTCISGGAVAFFTSAFCYIGDVSTEKNRGLRMVIIQTSATLGFLFGSLLMTSFHKIAGPNANAAVFLTASSCCSLAFFYTLCILPESVNCNGHQKSLLNFGLIKDMVGTVFKKRRNHGQFVVLLLVIICATCVAVSQGEMSVRYLSLRKSFSWSLEDFTEFSAMLCLIMAITSLLGMWILNQLLQIHEIYILLVVSLMAVISEILVASSDTSLFFILSVSVSCFSILTGPVTRSEISKIVPRSALGKAFAFLASIEALTPLAASPTYTLIYRSVLQINPLAVYYMSAALWCLNTILILIIFSIYNINGVPYHSNEDEGEITQNEERISINT